MISEVLQYLGAAGHGVAERAESTDVKARLRARTKEAQRCGIFGAAQSEELFWGNDRLEYTLDWGDTMPTE